jgi:tellurite resistance protein TerA
LNQSLKPGENTTITATQGRVVVSHAAGAGLDVNLTAFLVTETGKVVDDSGMVFLQCPEHSSGAAVCEPAIKDGIVSHSISFDSSRLPSSITKIAITLTQDGSAGGFAAVRTYNLVSLPVTKFWSWHRSPSLRRLASSCFELYVRNSQLKARSVWQGFASGLTGLCSLYGIEVEDEAPSAPVAAPTPATAPKPVNIAKTVVTLDKPVATRCP